LPAGICRSREENKAKARALWQQGNKTAAFECYQRAVDISPVVAKGFIDVS
jgi:exonuclease-1